MKCTWIVQMKPHPYFYIAAKMVENAKIHKNELSTYTVPIFHYTNTSNRFVATFICVWARCYAWQTVVADVVIVLVCVWLLLYSNWRKNDIILANNSLIRALEVECYIECIKIFKNPVKILRFDRFTLKSTWKSQFYN